MPTRSPPIAGHHIQWIGNFANASSTAYNAYVIDTDSNPEARPAITLDPIAHSEPGATDSGNSGPASVHSGCRKPATAQASATGSRLRGRNSNSNSSTASNTAVFG